MDGARGPLRRWLWPGLLGLPLLVGWALVLWGGGPRLWAWIALTQLLPLLGALGLLIALGRVLWRRAPSAPLLVGTALSLLAAWPLLWLFGWFAIAYPASLEHSAPAATVRLPSDLPLRVVWGGDALAVNQHAASPGQRWAYDLIVEPGGHGSTDLSAYGCFDTPVLAPTSARVYRALDAEPDLAIGATLADPSRLLGNHVILELDGGTYLVLAHLKEGSVRVRSGERVAEGQELGRCGNSGNSSEPHIHIHHQRDDPLRWKGELNLGVNFAQGLPLYFRDHDGAPMPEGGLGGEAGAIELRGALVTHRGGAR